MAILHCLRGTTTTRPVRAALLVTGVLLATVFGAAGAASAGAPALTSGTAATSGGSTAANCLPKSLCLYEGPNFTGAQLNVSSLVQPGTCVSLVDHGWGDRAHSARNTHPQSAAMFMNDDCLGGPFQVPGNSSIPDFGSFTPESVWVPYGGS
jgi:hypothetical protein